VIEALALKEGDEIEIRVSGDRGMRVEKSENRRRIVDRLDKCRGRRPADFKFDRLEARARERGAFGTPTSSSMRCRRTRTDPGTPSASCMPRGRSRPRAKSVIAEPAFMVSFALMP
jgi:antitoxin MazE